MLLFADRDDANMAWIFYLSVLVPMMYVMYRAFVFFYRPKQWAAERRMKHEREMAASAERRLVVSPEG